MKESEMGIKAWSKEKSSLMKLKKKTTTKNMDTGAATHITQFHKGEIEDRRPCEGNHLRSSKLVAALPLLLLGPACTAPMV